MRSKIVAVTAFALSVLLCGVVYADAPLHRVSGGGKYVLDDGTFETYGFSVRVDRYGNVKGQGELHFQVEEAVNIHFKANCLAVEGNTAWLGGVVTRSSNPSFAPVGIDITWQLRDNGEGAAAAPDIQSNVVPTELLNDAGLGMDCNDMGYLFGLGTFDWTHGNVQVK